MEAIYKERILQLADHLEAMPRHQFSMECWLEPTDEPDEDADPYSSKFGGIHNCETVGCIAGHAILLFYNPDGYHLPIDEPNFDMDFAGEAQYLLGLDDGQASALFSPSHSGDPRDDLQCEPKDVTNYDAAETLRNFADTETVHWFCGTEPDDDDDSC